VNLEELERDMLRGARRELMPTASDRERHHAQLLVRLDAPPAGARGGPSGAMGWGRVTRAPLGGSRWGTLGVGLLVGAMIGGWFGFGLGRGGWGGATSGVTPGIGLVSGGSEGGSTTSRLVSPVTGAPPGEDAPPGDPPPAPEPPPAVEGVKPSSNEPERASHGAATGRPRSARSALPTVASPESSLAAELAMLQRARRALAAENGALALGIVEELDERFPKGLLLEERTATRVLSLCKLERVDAARREALRFLERYPASVYAERVRQSCVGSAAE
jgi:hypothetical protein